MTHSHRPGLARTALAATLASLLLAGIALLASGCQDAFTAPGAASVQTTEALALLPPDADVMGMMDFEAARTSDAIRTVTGGAGLGMFSPDGSADFDAFVRMTGFDPAQDLDRVYIAAREGTAGAERAAFVAYGRFDRTRIERYIADQDDAEFETTDVEGVPVYLTASDDGRRGGFALPNDRMVLAGDEATLRAMLGRVGTTGTAPSPDLQALLDRVAYPDGAWFVARRFDAAPSGPQGDSPMGLAAQMAQSVVVSMDLKGSTIPFRAFVVPFSPDQTADLADFMKGSLAAARMGVKDTPAALDVLDRAEVTTREGGVDIEATLTPQFLAEMHR